MRQNVWAIYIAMLTGAVFASWPVGDARACSLARCTDVQVGYGPEGLDIPPNIGALRLDWRGRRPRDVEVWEGSIQELKIVAVESGEPAAFELRERSILLLEQPLEPDKEYEVSGFPKRACGGFSEQVFGDGKARFKTTSEPLPEPPTTLGELLVGPTRWGWLSVGCGRQYWSRQVEIAIDPEFVGPWAPYLHYTTYYSDRDPTLEEHREQWRPRRWTTSNRYGASDLGRGVDRFAIICDGSDRDESESARAWAVQLEARIPGTEIVIKSEPAEIVLSCDRHDPPMPLSLRPAQREAISVGESLADGVAEEGEGLLDEMIRVAQKERLEALESMDFGGESLSSDEGPPWLLIGAIFLSFLGGVLLIFIFTEPEES